MQIQKIMPEFDGSIDVFARKTGLSVDKTREAVMRSYRYAPFGDDARIRKVLQKAMHGEKIVVAGIGGSITEGACARTGNNVPELSEALGGEKSYFTRITEYLRDKTGAEVEAINCGIGATPSFLGALRAEKMAFSKSPDLVTVEFSVNDLTPKELKDGELLSAYESIITRALETGSAVMAIFLVEESGGSFAEKHAEITKFHKVPAISYRDAIFTDGGLITEWKNISPDDTHPNNLGHAFLGVLIENYFANLLDEEKEEKVEPFSKKTLFPELLKGADMIFARDADEKDGFEIVSREEKVSANWKGVATATVKGAKISFTVPKGTKKAFVIYSNSLGKFRTCFLGTESERDTSTKAWPKPMWHRFYDGDGTEKDEKVTVETLGDEKCVIIGVGFAF